MQKFLGLVNYVRHWVFDFPTITAPLLKAVKITKDRHNKIYWTPEMTTAFTQLNDEITNAPVLGSPDYTK